MTCVRVALLWHMHQPSYRDPIDGSIRLPWVRLHALKDYWGMVAVLKETPNVHVTFNLVPSLLDQIEGYVGGVARELQQQLCMKPASELERGERIAMLRELFMAHEKNVIAPLPRYAELLARRGHAVDEASLYAAEQRFSTQDLRDLQVLAKVAWFDLDWRAADHTVRSLILKARDYTEEDKRTLAEREATLLASILPVYRHAAGTGQIELSTSPYYHPILPLLCDTESHHEAYPGAPLPSRYRHPEDALDQIERALRGHARAFGQPPRGMWPSEGAVSEEAVGLMARAGLAWTASDEGVLARSLGVSMERDGQGVARPCELLYRAWRRQTDTGSIKMLFRDHMLSDLVGFAYSGMDPKQAAQDLLGRWRRIGKQWQREARDGDPVVSVILDGENAWEYFPDGGRTFLRTLYRGLEEDPNLQAVTMSEAIASSPPAELPRVFAGSWINADLSIWIGHADDRRAWERLAEARCVLAAHDAAGSPAVGRAWEIFRAACGSDWCWWYGEEHRSDDDFEFDRLFRRHLQAMYETLGEDIPEVLFQSFVTTRKAPMMQTWPGGAVTPTPDGEISGAEEWQRAGTFRTDFAGAMHRGLQTVRGISFGEGEGRLHVLIETTGRAGDHLAHGDMSVEFPGEPDVRYRLRATAARFDLRREERSERGWKASASEAWIAVGSVIELGIPLAELGREAKGFFVRVRQGETELERHPVTGLITFESGGGER